LLMEYYTTDTKKVSIPPKVLTAAEELSVRYDLIDCRIDICAPEVLFLVKDNWDYADLRKHVIQGVLRAPEEISVHKIHTHIVSGEYAARVKDLKTYVSVSKDIIHRWTYPMVLDNNFMGDTSFKYLRSFVYKEKNVKLHLSSHIGEETVIGEGTVIGANTSIADTCIGRNCIIGSNVTIKGAFLWDGVTVEDDCFIENSLLCNGAHLLQGATVKGGSVISFQVVIGRNIKLLKETKLTTKEPTMEELQTTTEPTEGFDLGEGGIGRKWVMEEEEERNKLLVESDEEIDSEEEESEVEDDLESHSFESEVGDIIHTHLNSDKLDVDTLFFNIRERQMAHHRSFVDVLELIISLLFDSIPVEVLEIGELYKRVKKLLLSWKDVIGKFVSAEGKERTSDQVEFIFVLQAFCEEPKHERFERIWKYILHECYSLDLIEEPAIWKWVSEHKELPEAEKKFLKASNEFLKWLSNAESESSEE